MPTEVWVAIIALGGPLLVALGYFLRPLGEYFGEIIRDRRAQTKRRDEFQFATLVAISEALQVQQATGELHASYASAVARWQSLTFRVADDELRALLEKLMVAPTRDEFNDTHGNVLRRLGQVMREM